MSGILRQSTAVDVLIGPFLDLTDGSTPETGEAPAVALSKAGQALAAKSDVTTPVHDAAGYYNCELDATDTGTVGELVLEVPASANAFPVRHIYQVISQAAYDAVYASGATGPGTPTIYEAAPIEIASTVTRTVRAVAVNGSGALTSPTTNPASEYGVFVGNTEVTVTPGLTVAHTSAGLIDITFDASANPANYVNGAHATVRAKVGTLAGVSIVGRVIASIAIKDFVDSGDVHMRGTTDGTTEYDFVSEGAQNVKLYFDNASNVLPAGSVVGNVDAAVTTRATATGQTTMQTAVDAIPTNTEWADTDPANGTRALTVPTNLTSDGNAVVNTGYHVKALLKYKNATGNDEYTFIWFKHDTPISTGITGHTVTVTDIDADSTLISAVVPTNLTNTRYWRFTEATNLVGAGTTVGMQFNATIDGGPREFALLAKKQD